MCKILTFSSIIVLMNLFACQSNINKPSEINDLATVLDLITDPPVEYRTAPLWDWNDKINREDIEFQLQQFKMGGLGGVFIHPRPGLVTDYLSDDWNSLFKFTVEKGKELGMKVWIYDENSYPSGFAGGHVQDRFPDSYKQGTGLGLKITANLFDTIGINIEAILQTDPNSEYYIFYRTFPAESWWYGGFPYVDLLVPGVTDTFIRATMEGYEQYFGEEFGHTVPGVFTDEPNLPAAKGPGTVIRWTPDLFDRFHERWGYALEDQLISLVEEYGDWKKVRHNYHELMLELFLDRWAVPWNEYCEENDLIWTGHYWEHGWPYPGEGYDESAFYMYHQMPGIDMLGRVLCEDGMCQQFGNIRAVRELASAANQSGARRRFSETYGGGGWQVSFSDLKRLVDWECVLGVNFVNQHLSYFSMQGVRKFDYPPSFSYQEPWWPNHKLLGDYIARVSLALSAGEQINEVLIIQPNTTAWMYHADADQHNEVFQLSTIFKKFLIQLEANQLEYDLGSEQVLKRFGDTQQEGLRVGERVYSKIILPPGLRNLDSATLALLAKHVEYGHELMVLSDSITYLDGSESTEFKKLLAKHSDQITQIESSQRSEITEWFEQKDISFKIMEGNPELLFHQRRKLDDGELLFLVNSSDNSSIKIDLSWIGKHLAEVDLITGEIIPVQHQKIKNRIEASLSLPAIGSRLLISSSRKLTTEILPNDVITSEVEAHGSVSINRISDNVLTLDYLDLETKDFKLNDIYFMDAMYKLFEWSQLPTGNPWQHKIQFKQTYVEMDHFDKSTWHNIQYQFEVDGKLTTEQLNSLKLVAERPEIWTVDINGHILNRQDGEWWLDKHFPVYSIGEFVHSGRNIVTLKAEIMSVFAEIMPVYILGDFSLRKAEKGFIIHTDIIPALGNWSDWGLPFYGNQVSYKQKFVLDEAPKENESYYIRIENWKGSVGEVWVNGQLSEIIGWQEEAEVTKTLNAGANEVEFRVTGSLKNTLGFHHKDLTGWIDGPWSWNEAPDHQPSGKDYRFMNYGMEGKIRLLRKNY